MRAGARARMAWVAGALALALPTAAHAQAASAPAAGARPSEAAQSANATAMALLVGGNAADAFGLANQAVQLAPDWSEPYLTRSRVHASLAGPHSTLDQLGHIEPGEDYARMAAELQASADDLEKYSALSPALPPEEHDKVIAAVGALRARAIEARKLADAQVAARQQQEAQERAHAEEQARALEAQQAEERARAEALAAEERKKALTSQREREEAERAASAREAEEARGRRARRTTGYVLSVLGVASGGAAIAFARLGAGQNSAVQGGGYGTGGQIDDAIGTGKTFNTLAWIGLAGAGGFLAIGIPLVLLNQDPSSVRVGTCRGLPGLCLSGVVQ